VQSKNSSQAVCTKGSSWSASITKACPRKASTVNLDESVLHIIIGPDRRLINPESRNEPFEDRVFVVHKSLAQFTSAVRHFSAARVIKAEFGSDMVAL
jgi:hypothetical protein